MDLAAKVYLWRIRLDCLLNVSFGKSADFREVFVACSAERRLTLKQSPEASVAEPRNRQGGLNAGGICPRPLATSG